MQLNAYVTSGSSPPPLAIIHVTLNTGDAAVVPQDFLTKHVELHQRFQEIVKAGGGPCPNIPHLSCEVSEAGQDSAALSIHFAGLPVVFGIVCCDDDESHKLWSLLTALYKDWSLQGAASGVEASPMPPKSPWLGVILLLPIITLPVSTLPVLAVLEENLAIAFALRKGGAA